MRIEDYEYKDDHNQMAETVLKLMNSVTTELSKDGIYRKGIVILATNPLSTPNSRIANELNSHGYPNLTLRGMMLAAESSRIEVLNHGTAVGYLRYADSGSDDNYSWQDIVIFEELPERVPIVSGIITLQPQTPLSHINLLAKNRGTLNLYTLELSNLPGIEDKLNSLVKIDTTNGTIQIIDVSETYAQYYWDTMARDVIELPEPVKNHIPIIEFASASQVYLTPEVIGAKASNYAKLQHNFPQYVRPAFALPFYSYYEVINNCNAGELISYLNEIKSDISESEINLLLNQIQQEILNSELPSETISEIRSVVANGQLGEKIRLRSSTNCEDIAGFNGAGLYLSNGFRINRSDAELAEEILEVYASLWGPLAFAEREYFNIDHSDAAMGILINQSFSNEYANGVVVTLPSLQDISVLINVQPSDFSVTNAENGMVPESILYSSFQNNTYSFLSKSSLSNVFFQNESEEYLLHELKLLTTQIHMLFIDQLQKENPQVDPNNWGIDIEFKIMLENRNLKIYVKQARLLQLGLPE